MQFFRFLVVFRVRSSLGFAARRWSTLVWVSDFDKLLKTSRFLRILSIIFYQDLGLVVRRPEGGLVRVLVRLGISVGQEYGMCPQVCQDPAKNRGRSLSFGSV